LFADLYLNYFQKDLNSKSYIWDIIGVTATFSVFWLDPQNVRIFPLGSVICLLLIFISTFKGKILNFFYTRKFIYITGGMCYTIYLIHYGFLAYFMKFTSNIGFEGSLLLNLLIQAVIMLPILFIVSSVFFLLFEKPFMYKDWPARLLQCAK
jgi:peptidoglycan/LPS O-acetylase OafA/YrhL